MLRYETLYLTIPEITTDESSTIERQLEKVLKDNQATLISFERWGKFKLAYPVRKNEYGVYFLVRYETAPENGSKTLEDLTTFFRVKHNDLVMRFMTTALDPEKPLTYQRPESLEEAPARERESGSSYRENRERGAGHYPRSSSSQSMASEAL